MLLIGTLFITALSLTKLCAMATQIIAYDTAPTLFFVLSLSVACLGFMRAHCKILKSRYHMLALCSLLVVFVFVLVCFLMCFSCVSRVCCRVLLP